MYYEHSHLYGFKHVMIAVTHEGKEYPIAAFGESSPTKEEDLPALAKSITAHRGLADVRVELIPERPKNMFEYTGEKPEVVFLDKEADIDIDIELDDTPIKN